MPRESDLDRLASGGHAGTRQQRIGVARRVEPAAVEERGARRPDRTVAVDPSRRPRRTSMYDCGE